MKHPLDYLPPYDSIQGFIVATALLVVASLCGIVQGFLLHQVLPR